MLTTPLAAKVIPICMAGLLATMPIYDMTKVQKDSTNTTIEQNTDNTTKINDKTNQQTTKIVTIREGYKGVILDGKIFEVPFYQKTTVEKTYQEKEQEQGKQENIGNKQQDSTSQIIEDVPGQQISIVSKVVDSGKAVVHKIWKKVTPW